MFYIVKFTDSKQIVEGFKNLGDFSSRKPFKSDAEVELNLKVLAKWEGKWYEGIVEVIDTKKPFLSKEDQGIKAPEELGKAHRVKDFVR